jgi:transposase
MYQAMDKLHANAAKVEETIFFETADLMNLEVDLVFYDTTTCRFSIDDADDEAEGIRMFGRPKEGGWAPQVIVALAVTREGLPVRSWVFPGNTSDATTVKRIKQDLRGWKLGRALFVGDSGMNSAENRRELARACGRYLLAVRTGSVKEVKEEVLNHPGRYRTIGENLKAKEVVVGSGELRRRYIVCFNPREAKREAAHRLEVVEELKEELASHKSRDATAKWAIKLLASGRYGRYVKVAKGNKIALDKGAISAAKKMDGKWVLITNDDTLSVEDAATGYRSLLIIERCFRTLKRTQIQLTPMYHWVTRRIESHVKICVLALLIQRTAELAWDKPWPLVRRLLDKLQATEYRNDSHAFFETNELPKEAARFLKLLKIPPPNSVIDIQLLP